MADDKRRAILHATLCLLSQRGFHGFSMKQLADHAGVAAGTIYLYFRDKEDLIQQLHQDIIREVGRQLLADVDQNWPLSQQYRQIASNLWRFSLNCPEIMLCKGQFDSMPPDVLYGAQPGSLSDAVEKRDEIYAPIQPIRDLFEQGRQRKEIKDLPDEVLVALGINPICNLAREHYLGLTEIDDRTVDDVIEAGWDAIRIHAGGR